MSTLAEIQEAIHKLSPAEQAELRQSLLEEETAAMMAAIAEGTQRVGRNSRAHRGRVSQRREMRVLYHPDFPGDIRGHAARYGEVAAA